MPKLTIEVPHALGEQEALDRVKNFMAKIKEKYQSQVSNLEEAWNGNMLSFGFSTYGFPVKGTFDVASNQVKVDGDLPFAAMMFKGKIEQEVKSQLERLLA